MISAQRKEVVSAHKLTSCTERRFWFILLDARFSAREGLCNSLIHRSLKDGGKLIIDIMGKEILARIFRARDWREQDGDILLEERRVIDDWNRMESQWTLLRGAIRHEATITHWIYSAAELGALLQGCGFRSVDHYGSLEGIPYDHTARRLVTVAHK